MAASGWFEFVEPQTVNTSKKNRSFNSKHEIIKLIPIWLHTEKRQSTDSSIGSLQQSYLIEKPSLQLQ